MHILVKFFSAIMSINFIFKFFINKRLVIFNYHEISNDPSEFCIDHSLNVSPENFEKQVKYIKKYFNVITPQQLISGNYKLPGALITFDDGFKGAFVNGGAILKKYNIPAVIFLNMAPIEGKECWSGLVSYLFKNDKTFIKFLKNKYNKKDLFLNCTEVDLKEYHSKYNKDIPDTKKYHGEFANNTDLMKSINNGIYLGNHLYNHYNAKILPLMRLKDEYLINQNKLSEFKNYTYLFSYPFGQPKKCYDDNTNQVLFDLGAKKLFTAYQLFNSNNNNILNRTSMYNYINSESLFKSNCIFPAIFNGLFRNGV